VHEGFRKASIPTSSSPLPTLDATKNPKKQDASMDASSANPVAVMESSGSGLRDVDPYGRLTFKTVAGKQYFVSKC
jgi:hypothetical protein